ncbi:OmpA family protein [Candidatus Dependentiae bacterium]|nr:OmpA family protein [Candidatus Dependentiae bacterium]
MKLKFEMVIVFCILTLISSCSFTPSYQKILMEKDNSINELKSSLTQKTDESEHQKMKNAQLEEELKTIKETLKNEQEKLKETSKTLDMANNQIGVLKKESEQMFANLENEKKLKLETQAKFDSSEGELKSSKENILKLSDEIKTKINIISELEKSLSDIKKQVLTANTEIQNLKGQIEILKNQIEKNKLDNESKLKVEFEKQKNLESTISALNNKIQELQVKNSELETKNNKLAGDIEFSVKSFEEYKNSSLNKIKEIELKSEAALKNAENKKNEEINKIASENNKLKEELAKMAAIESSKKNLEEKVKSLEIERDKIVAELEKNKADEIKKLMGENSKIKEELEKLENKNQFLVKESQKGIEITFLDKILFDQGKADLKKESLNALKNVAKILNNYPDRNIIIEGHTDNKPIKTPKFPSNWELSAGRAVSVLRFFVDKTNIPKNRISVQGFADTRPVSDNSSENGRRLNRRVEIILLPQDLKIEKVEQK